MVGEVATLLRELLQSWEQALASEKLQATRPMRAVAVA
jgi:hypothetical protein